MGSILAGHHHHHHHRPAEADDDTNILSAEAIAAAGDPGVVLAGGDGSQTLTGSDGDDVLYGHGVADEVVGSGDIRAELVANIGFGAVFAGGAPGDDGYLYALNKETGVISRIDTATGEKSLFLDIADGEFKAGGEQGVLNFAFHPDYASNGRFFVFMVDPAGDLVLREYQRQPGTPPTADATSFRNILEIRHPDYTNHNGGSLNFGPDGFLYIATGDGGSANDPSNNAQNLNSLLGKILRIDVDTNAAGRNYGIPADNPYTGPGIDGRDEIWAAGLRNPWRVSFDPDTGDLYIGDVGQGAQEEVDYLPFGNAGGANFGWDFREGTVAGPSGSPGDLDFVDPIHTYGRALGESITGGYVYRGPAAGLQGAYVFADFISGRLFTLDARSGTSVEAFDRTQQIVGASIGNVASFGIANDKSLFAVTLGGEIYRLIPGETSGDGNDVLRAGAGNDRLYGGVGMDVLDGGADADTMTGGLGDDSFYVDDPNDAVVELAGAREGYDTVHSSIDFVLAPNVEKLVLTGSGAVDGTGNELVNAIYGNTAANTLSGGAGSDRIYGGGGHDVLNGGTGGDLMSGGAGSDRYYVDNAGDRIVEGSADGTADAVISTVSESLAANVEELVLAGGRSIAGNGNALDNTLTGNSGANTLNGGRGDDLLRGASGRDTFVFDTEPSSTNVDRIRDYSHSADTVRLDDRTFRVLDRGRLEADEFKDVGRPGATVDGDDHIIYDSDNGRLYYDYNGSAAGGRTVFAILDNHAYVNATDFIVF